MGNNIGILETWYNFHNTHTKLKPSEFILDLYTSRWKEELFHSGRVRVRSPLDVISNDSLIVYSREDHSPTSGNSKLVKNFKKKLEECANSNITTVNTYAKKQETYLSNLINTTYKDDWYNLLLQLKAVFYGDTKRFEWSSWWRRKKMKALLETISNDEDGKKDFTYALYNCLYLVTFTQLAPELEISIIDDEQYAEYYLSFQRYGMYSYQSNLIIQKLATTGNLYALYNLAQMYYYGKGIAPERNLKKTYDIYEQLNKEHWRYPLFLWARADFIIEYYSCKFGKKGPFSNVNIPELDCLSEKKRSDLFDSLINDLIYAEEKGCGSAANLCGNILNKIAISKYPQNFEQDYKRMLRILAMKGNATTHYLRGARDGNSFSYYHLYRIFRTAFITNDIKFCREHNVDNPIEYAFTYLEKSAETYNPRAINEIGVIYGNGIKWVMQKEIVDFLNERRITGDEFENANERLNNLYGENDKIDYKKSYKCFSRIYDASIKQSNFKWPICNMINLLRNEGFLRDFDTIFEDDEDYKFIKNRISDVAGQIIDVKTALNYLPSKVENNNNTNAKITDNTYDSDDNDNDKDDRYAKVRSALSDILQQLEASVAVREKGDVI